MTKDLVILLKFEFNIFFTLLLYGVFLECYEKDVQLLAKSYYVYLNNEDSLKLYKIMYP